MKRRTAIGRILVIGAGGGLLFSGYKWYDWNKKPDLTFLSGQQDLLTALAETIIPATDTPGAKEAEVGSYILLIIRDCTETKVQNKFIDGLKDLKSYSLSKYDKEYQQCTASQQQQILRHFEEKGRPWGGIAGKIQTRYLGATFFSTLKSLTVEGYCTSQAGATRALNYLAVPGRFQGCMPMLPGQTTWATK